jgi:phosphoenolpyruvate carboxykinase (GTP)
VEGTAKAQQTPIGNLPTPDALDLSGLNLPGEDVKCLLAVDAAGWQNEVADVAANYAKFDSHLPKALNGQLDGLKKRLG